MRKVLYKVAEVSQAQPCFRWYARVPSSSNLADAPSRLQKLEVFQGISKHVRADLTWLERLS